MDVQPGKVTNEESKVGSFMLNLMTLNKVLRNILSPQQELSIA